MEGECAVAQTAELSQLTGFPIKNICSYKDCQTVLACQVNLLRLYQ